MNKQSLTLPQWVAVVLLAGPPLVSVFCDVGPGRLVNAGQDAVIGGHFYSLSVLAVLLLELGLIWFFAITVRRLTGRTLVELFTKKKPPD
jgi:hypothetical protein